METCQAFSKTVFYSLDNILPMRNGNVHYGLTNLSNGNDNILPMRNGNLMWGTHTANCVSDNILPMRNGNKSKAGDISAIWYLITSYL